MGLGVNAMLNIAIKSQNTFFQLGIIEIINNFLNDDNIIYKIISANAEQNAINKSNIFFTEDIAIINIFENISTERPHYNLHPQATIHIPCNGDSIFSSDLATIIARIFNFATMSYKELIQNELFRKLISRQNSQLSTKENRVVMLMSQGYDANHISKLLNCSQSTIYTHQRNATRKLGLFNRIQFYKYSLLLKEFCYRENYFLTL